MNNPLYVHVHIPKCAGVTLQSIMSRYFSVNNTKNGFTFRYPRGTNPKDGWDKVKHIYGHFRIGLPSEDENFEGRDFIYFTLLRDPIERMYSNYYFASRNISIWEWLESNDPFINNLMTRYLGNTEGNPIGKHLFQAEANLSLPNMYFGIVEYFDESLRRFQETFPDIFADLSYVRQNVTNENANKRKHKPKDYNKDPMLNFTIKEYNRLDIELYDYALKLFKEGK